MLGFAACPTCHHPILGAKGTVSVGSPTLKGAVLGCQALAGIETGLWHLLENPEQRPLMGELQVLRPAWAWLLQPHIAPEGLCWNRDRAGAQQWSVPAEGQDKGQWI